MGKRKRTNAERDAQKLAHDYTQFSEGHWLGEKTLGDPGNHPAMEAVVRRFNETTEGRRQCPHLTANWDQARFWVEAVPELLACKECTPVLGAKEQERRNTRCTLCGRHVALRGISLAVGGYVLRSGMCQDCEAVHGVPAAE